MKIESIHVKNFRSLRNIELNNIPPLAVFIGENGVGKSTLFRVFAFLKNCLRDDVPTALAKEGGINGYQEVVSRGAEGEPIVIQIQYEMQIAGEPKLVTYRLEIGYDAQKGPVVSSEILRYKCRAQGKPFHFLDFKEGKGFAISNEAEFNAEDSKPAKEEQELEGPGVLAIKGIGQFQRFVAAAAFRSLIESWHVSDFHISDSREPAREGLAEHLSESGDNLPLVAQYLQERHKKQFDKIVAKFRERIPGMQSVVPHQTEDGQVLLRFKDGAFEKPFTARYVSDGTIKMFAYLVLLYDPAPHPFLCVEEPENQLHPKLTGILAEELRRYAGSSRQVLVSTHSPDFVNHLRSDEVFVTSKHNGQTYIRRAADDPQINALVNEGDQLGWLWTQELLEKAAIGESSP